MITSSRHLSDLRSSAYASSDTGPSYSAQQIATAAQQVASVKDEIESLAFAEAVVISVQDDDETDLDAHLSDAL
eukprot:6891791-Karenia_brevis.AAC.1